MMKSHSYELIAWSRVLWLFAGSDQFLGRALLVNLRESRSYVFIA